MLKTVLLCHRRNRRSGARFQKPRAVRRGAKRKLSTGANTPMRSSTGLRENRRLPGESRLTMVGTRKSACIRASMDRARAAILPVTRASMKLATLAPKGRWTIRRQTANDRHPGASNAGCAGALSRLIGRHHASLRPYSGFFMSSRTRVVNPLSSCNGAGSARDARSTASRGLEDLPELTNVPRHARSLHHEAFSSSPRRIT